MLHIFVYGTLKPRFTAYEQFCAGRTIAETPAIVHGQLYHLPLGYPAIVLGNGIVQGYRLTFRDPQVLLELDDYEAHDRAEIIKICPDRPEANEYSRSWIPTFSMDGQPLGNAWVYSMTIGQIDRLKGNFITTGTWRGNP